MIARLCNRCGATAFDVTPATPFTDAVVVPKTVTIVKAAPATNQAAVTADFSANLSVTLTTDLCGVCAIQALHAYIAAVGG